MFPFYTHKDLESMLQEKNLKLSDLPRITKPNANDIVMVGVNGELGFYGTNPNKEPTKFQSNCNSCAGPLNHAKHACEYCGTEYRLAQKPLPQQRLQIPPRNVPDEKKEKAKTSGGTIAMAALGGILLLPLMDALTRRR